MLHLNTCTSCVTGAACRFRELLADLRFSYSQLIPAEFKFDPNSVPPSFTSPDENVSGHLASAPLSEGAPRC